MESMSFFRNGRRAFYKVHVGVLCGMLLAACASLNPSLPAETATMQPGNPSEGYLLEQGNRVRITVFNEPNLSGDFTLDPSGALSMTLLGSIPASGITARTLANRIEAILKKDGYFQDPKVSVEVQTFRPFYVLGEVRQAGEFPYITGMTVLSAVAKAGGYDYRAWEGEVLLVRTINNEQKEYRAVERTPILPGDIVKVLQRRI